MKPKRIQRKRTKGWKMPKNTVYVGRPTKWGNPFREGETMINPIFDSGILHGMIRDKKQVVRDYIDWLKLHGRERKAKKELKGKNLACWCSLYTPCHADILLKIANS